MRLFLDFTLFFSVIILLPLTSALVQPGKTLLTFEKGEGGLMTELRQVTLHYWWCLCEIHYSIVNTMWKQSFDFNKLIIRCFTSGFTQTNHVPSAPRCQVSSPPKNTALVSVL